MLQFYLKFERYRQHKDSCHLTKCDVINDLKLFPTVCYRIYCRKFLTLSNQMSLYKSKHIRIDDDLDVKLDADIIFLCSLVDDIFSCFCHFPMESWVGCGA